MSPEDDVRSLSAGSLAAWDRNAEVWDQAMASGRGYQKVLVEPVLERLLELKPGEVVLEVACGNGVFARRMAEYGVSVMAVDFSGKLIELAKARTVENADRIEYRQVDATDLGELLALGMGRYHAVVCSMALMDIPTLEPLASALPELLQPRGRFAFSVMHPCHNNPSIIMAAEEEDREGVVAVTRHIKVSKYLGLTRGKGKALYEQPVLQDYYDRPLHSLLAPFFRAGLALDALEEPPYPDTGSKNPLSWANFREFSPVLIGRMRRGANSA